MEREYLNEFVGKKYFLALMPDGGDWRGAGISCFTIEGVASAPQEENDNAGITFDVRAENGEELHADLLLGEWKKLFHKGYVIYACAHYSISNKWIEKTRREYLRKMVQRELDGYNWDTRAWQLACHLYTQTWSKYDGIKDDIDRYAKRMYATTKCVEFAYQLVADFKEKATETKIKQMEEFYNNSNK